MTEWTTIGNARLACGNCLEILPELTGVDAVVTDPPYGIGWNTNTKRFEAGKTTNRKPGDGRDNWGDIKNDDKPFDPQPWLGIGKRQIFFGANHFAQRLPPGTNLVWIKRYDAAFESFLSDAEIAWMRGGNGVYCRREIRSNVSDKERFHPTQKPVGIMEWCIKKTTGTVLDPYMGSGTTGVACAKLGRSFIGIELEPRYFDIACKRIEDAQKQADLFVEPPAPAPTPPDQEALAL